MSTRPELADPSLLREANYIAGEWVDADGGATMEIFNPATGRLIGAVPASATETRRVVEAAHEAFPMWRALLAKGCAAIIRRMADLMLSNANDLAAIMRAEQGKPLAEARGEIACFLSWSRRRRCVSMARSSRPTCRGGACWSGSTETGRKLLEQCARTIKRTSMELGGTDGQTHLLCREFDTRIGDAATASRGVRK